MNEALSKAIANAIMRDLSDRRGILNDVDDDVLDEMREEFAGIALSALSALQKARPGFAGRVFVDQLTGQRDVQLSAEGKQLPDMARLYAHPQPAQQDARDAELARLRRIAELIGSIFVHGGFKAETHNERELEKLLREQGTFYDSLAEFDAALAAAKEKQ